MAYYINKNMRITQERYAIANAISKLNNVFSLDDLSQAVEMAGFHISRATIYNNLKIAIDAGVIHRRHIDSVRQSQYEKLVGLRFAHLVCEVCGKVKDVKDNTFSAFMNAKKYNAFTTTHYELTVYGICNTCARKTKRRRKTNK
ncbi:MAG: transcriptional repressor [Muribaculaceae bacterium]|nr:transcriptional repressor [Muribaculaceae bacterium]